jgi:UDP-N-acetylmuramate--alanine ligase
MNILKDKDFEVLLTMGAGDIDKFVNPIKELIEKR